MVKLGSNWVKSGVNMRSNGADALLRSDRARGDVERPRDDRMDAADAVTSIWASQHQLPITWCQGSIQQTCTSHSASQSLSQSSRPSRKS